MIFGGSGVEEIRMGFPPCCLPPRKWESLWLRVHDPRVFLFLGPQPQEKGLRSAHGKAEPFRKLGSGKAANVEDVHFQTIERCVAHKQSALLEWLGALWLCGLYDDANYQAPQPGCPAGAHLCVTLRLAEARAILR